MKLTDEQRKQLTEDGYVHIKGVLNSAELTTLTNTLEQLWQAEGENAGSENYMEQNTRRLANLANKGEQFRELMLHPLAYEACQLVMGDDVRISMLNARDALPRSGARQMWHCDTDNSGIPDETGFYACTAIWMLDDFSAENGATYLVPRTHLSNKVPKMVMEDRFAPRPDEIRALGEPGDLFIFNGHCWHAGGANTSDRSRRALLMHYMRADWLPERSDRRQIISDDVADQLNSAESTLLGLND